MGREAFRSWVKERWKGAAFGDEPLAHHTSLKVGGPCDLMVFPQSSEDLKEILGEASKAGEPLLVMGRGTNLLVLDGGIRGTVLNLCRGLKEMEFSCDGVQAGAGVDLPLLAARAAKRGLSGLEFLSGIPGTVGGGAKGNAGAFGGSIDQVLERLWILNWQGQPHTFPRRDLAFSYRRCLLPCEGVIVEAEFRLRQEEPPVVQEKMESIQAERRRSQPLPAATAGSVFRNPLGAHAGEIIESLGLKGKMVGRARISELHANFIENLGGARAADVRRLIELVQERAERELNIKLELEVQVVGER